MIGGLFGGWAHFILDKIDRNRINIIVNRFYLFVTRKSRKEKLLVLGFHSCTLVMQLVVFCRSSGSEESWQSEQTSGAVDPGPADPDNPEPPHGGGPVPAAPDEHLQPPGAGGGASAHVGEPQAPDELPSRSVRWNVWSLLI